MRMDRIEFIVISIWAVLIAFAPAPASPAKLALLIEAIVEAIFDAHVAFQPLVFTTQAAT